MSLFTAATLRQINRDLAPERAQLFAQVLEDTCDLADLSTRRRVRHFVAQVAQETGGFRSLIESTRYSNPQRLDAMFRNVQGIDHARRLIAQGPAAIGNTIYAHKLGNGDAASGDGFRYRGRGFLQITGRANYRSIGQIVGMPLEKEPDLLGEPEPAARAAMTFWAKRAINRPADANDVGMVTQLVNGTARLHLKERTQWLRVAEKVWAGE